MHILAPHNLTVLLFAKSRHLARRAQLFPRRKYNIRFLNRTLRCKKLINFYNALCVNSHASVRSSFRDKETTSFYMARRSQKSAFVSGRVNALSLTGREVNEIQKRKNDGCTSTSVVQIIAVDASASR